MPDTSSAGDAAPAQRVEEWTRLDPVQLRYHKTQWETPKQSTKAFESFVAPALAASSSVVDLGCGAGAATAYIARLHPSIRFSGQDYVDGLVEMANSLSQANGIDNLHFQQSDWFNLPQSDAFDGVISLQTLSWLPEYQAPLEQIFTKLRPRWIALSSLFYAGDIACRIEVSEFKRDATSFYNVYSLPDIDRFCAQHGYQLSRVEPFEIDIDLEKPGDPDIMGTYTRRVIASDDPNPFERLQISGPLLLPWQMILIERSGTGLFPGETEAH